MDHCWPVVDSALLLEFLMGRSIRELAMLNHTSETHAESVIRETLLRHGYAAEATSSEKS
jgi:hypothetical protein